MRGFYFGFGGQKARLHPSEISMLGGSEFRLRNSPAANLRRTCAAPRCGAPAKAQLSWERKRTQASTRFNTKPLIRWIRGFILASAGRKPACRHSRFCCFPDKLEAVSLTNRHETLSSKTKCVFQYYELLFWYLRRSHIHGWSLLFH